VSGYLPTPNFAANIFQDIFGVHQSKKSIDVWLGRGMKRQEGERRTRRRGEGNGGGKAGKERTRSKASSRRSSAGGNMLAPAKGSPRQKDYVVVGGQKVYLNFIHAKRQNHSNFPIPHSLANPFVKESSLVGAVRSAPASTAAAKRSPSGSRRRAEDDAAAAEPPPVILELRNQIIEHELGRRGDDDADDCEFSIEEFTPPAAAAKKRKAAEAAAAASAIKRELEAVEMKRAAAAEQDKRAEREKRREIEKEKIARQKAKGKEKAHSSDSSEEDEGKDENDDEGGSEGEEEEEETDSPRSKRRRTTVEPARRQLPDKTPRTKSAVRHHSLCHSCVSSLLTANFVCYTEASAIVGDEQPQDFTHFPSRSSVTGQVAVHGAHLTVCRRVIALGQTHDTSQEPTDLRLFLRRLCIVSPAVRCCSNLEFDRACVNLNLNHYYLLYHFSLYPLLARSHVIAVGRIRGHFVLPRHD
jgi:hypothetical protein